MLHFNFVLISIKSFRSCNTISLDDYFTCSTIPIRSICIGDRYFSFCSKYLIFRTICLVKTNIKRCMHTKQIVRNMRYLEQKEKYLSPMHIDRIGMVEQVKYSSREMVLQERKLFMLINTKLKWIRYPMSF